METQSVSLCLKACGKSQGAQTPSGATLLGSAWGTGDGRYHPETSPGMDILESLLLAKTWCLYQVQDHGSPPLWGIPTPHLD